MNDLTTQPSACPTKSGPTQSRCAITPRHLLGACGLTLVLCIPALGQSLFHKAPEPRPMTAPHTHATQQPAPLASGRAGRADDEIMLNVTTAPTSAPLTAGESEATAAADFSAKAESGTVGAFAQPVPRLFANQPLRFDSVSLFHVVVPAPRTWQMHDKIELIINESSLASSTQKASNNKKFEWASELSQFPSIAGLLAQLELRNGIGSPTPKIGIKNDDKFTADGKYERSDRFTARISGLVVDVKPNGHLVIEAKESIQNDGELKTMVIAGVIDPKDITKANTVQSSQLANLVIKVENSGQVKDSTTKGLIPRIFETIFNF